MLSSEENQVHAVVEPVRSLDDEDSIIEQILNEYESSSVPSPLQEFAVKKGDDKTRTDAKTTRITNESFYTIVVNLAYQKEEKSLKIKRPTTAIIALLDALQSESGGGDKEKSLNDIALPTDPSLPLTDTILSFIESNLTTALENGETAINKEPYLSFLLPQPIQLKQQPLQPLPINIEPGSTNHLSYILPPPYFYLGQKISNLSNDYQVECGEADVFSLNKPTFMKLNAGEVKCCEVVLDLPCSDDDDDEEEGNDNITTREATEPTNDNELNGYSYVYRLLLLHTPLEYQLNISAGFALSAESCVINESDRIDDFNVNNDEVRSLPIVKEGLECELDDNADSRNNDNKRNESEVISTSNDIGEVQLLNEIQPPCNVDDVRSNDTDESEVQTSNNRTSNKEGSENTTSHDDNDNDSVVKLSTESEITNIEANINPTSIKQTYKSFLPPSTTHKTQLPIIEGTFLLPLLPSKKSKAKVLLNFSNKNSKYRSRSLLFWGGWVENSVLETLTSVAADESLRKSARDSERYLRMMTDLEGKSLGFSTVDDVRVLLAGYNDINTTTSSDNSETRSATISITPTPVPPRTHSPSNLHKSLKQTLNPTTLDTDIYNASISTITSIISLPMIVAGGVVGVVGAVGGGIGGIVWRKEEEEVAIVVGFEGVKEVRLIESESVVEGVVGEDLGIRGTNADDDALTPTSTSLGLASRVFGFGGRVIGLVSGRGALRTVVGENFEGDVDVSNTAVRDDNTDNDNTDNDKEGIVIEEGIEMQAGNSAAVENNSVEEVVIDEKACGESDDDNVIIDSKVKIKNNSTPPTVAKTTAIENIFESKCLACNTTQTLNKTLQTDLDELTLKMSQTIAAHALTINLINNNNDEDVTKVNELKGLVLTFKSQRKLLSHEIKRLRVNVARLEDEANVSKFDHDLMVSVGKKENERVKKENERLFEENVDCQALQSKNASLTSDNVRLLDEITKLEEERNELLLLGDDFQKCKSPSPRQASIAPKDGSDMTTLTQLTTTPPRRLEDWETLSNAFQSQLSQLRERHGKLMLILLGKDDNDSSHSEDDIREVEGVVGEIEKAIEVVEMRDFEVRRRK